MEELKHLMRTTQPDVVAIQESKLTPASRTLKIPHYTAIRTDREHKLINYIKSGTTFTHIKTPQTINMDNTEIHFENIYKTLQGHHHSQHIYIIKKHHDTTDIMDTDITNCIQYTTNSIITGDVNAHSGTHTQMTIVVN